MQIAQFCRLLMLFQTFPASSMLLYEENQSEENLIIRPKWEYGQDVNSRIKLALKGDGSGSPALHLLNIGLGTSYAPAAQRMHADADWINVFDQIHTHTQLPEDIKRDPRLKRHWEAKRGFGFWAWKPKILLSLMHETMKDGDVVVYLDSGCELGNANGWIDVLRPLRDFDLVTFRLSYPETKFCTGDIYKKVGMDVLTDKSFQVCATYFAMRRSPRTLKFVENWAELASDYHLISDEASQAANAPDFVDTRSDQSLFSVLQKSSSFVEVDFPMRAAPDMPKGDVTLPYFIPDLRTLNFNDVGYPPELHQFPFGAARNRFGGDTGKVMNYNPPKNGTDPTEHGKSANVQVEDPTVWQALGAGPKNELKRDLI